MQLFLDIYVDSICIVSLWRMIKLEMVFNFYPNVLFDFYFNVLLVGFQSIKMQKKKNIWRSGGSKLEGTLPRSINNRFYSA